jgi:trans-aconitate 2-methyltransferase
MWNPTQYNKFVDYRTRPALDLIARIPDVAISSLIDLGCGSGYITKLLQTKYTNADVTGLDSSSEMLDAARERFPSIKWQLENIANISATYDLVFSNAALQWMPNHEKLLPNLLEHTNQVLALQMPNNFDYPSHVLLRETINENTIWKDKLINQMRENPVLSQLQYTQLLQDKVRYLDIWQTQYIHLLEGDNPVLEWVKGTALLPIQENLPAEEFNKFIASYSAKLRRAYPQGANGITAFPFSRLFLIAIK